MRLALYVIIKGINVFLSLLLVLFLTFFFSDVESGKLIAAISFLFLLIVLYNEGYPVSVLSAKDKIKNPFEIHQYVFSKFKVFQLFMSALALLLVLKNLNLDIKYLYLVFLLPFFFITKVSSSIFKTRDKIILSAVLDSGLQNLIIMIIIFFLSVYDSKITIFILLGAILVCYIFLFYRYCKVSRAHYIPFKNRTIIKNNLLGYFYTNGYPIFMILFINPEDLSAFRFEERLFAIFSASYLFFQPLIVSSLHKKQSVIKVKKIPYKYAFSFLLILVMLVFALSSININLSNSYFLLALYAFFRFLGQIEITVNEVLSNYGRNLIYQVIFTSMILAFTPFMYISFGYIGISTSFIFSILAAYLYIFITRDSAYTVKK